MEGGQGGYIYCDDITLTIIDGQSFIDYSILVPKGEGFLIQYVINTKNARNIGQKKK